MIYTLGHSTRELSEFLRILKVYGIQRVVDVRRYPRSRRNPQFNVDTLPAALEEQGIAYLPLPELGGRRKPAPDSLNAAWESASFRGYADYMHTPEFRENLERLISATSSETTVILCAEALPWRCHRSLIADALLARGFEVEDIFDEKSSRPHHLPAWARVAKGQVSYPLVEEPEEGQE